LLYINSVFAKSSDFVPVPSVNIVRHTYYTLSYSEKNEQANWVYYCLTDSMVIKGGQERSSSFKMDKLIPTESAKSSDYTKSGFDRGHLCPAADMDFAPTAMLESFLMSNISPQTPDFNRGIWKELEEQVRDWAKKEREIYIITGPIFKDIKGVIGKEEVTVPGYFFKIIYDVTGNQKIIAFILPNEKSNRPLTDFAVPVDKTEELTGFDFFSQLPDDVENNLESKVQLAGWFSGYTSAEVPMALESGPKAEPAKSDFQFYLILGSVLLAVVLFVIIRSLLKKR
jgi:endonuclease G